jgi:hypothetical protein
MTNTMKSVAAAVGTALGLALAAPVSAQTTTVTGCDRLTGKARADCVANTRGSSYQAPLPGGNAGAGESESGPASMNRPATADTRREPVNAGGVASQGTDRSATTPRRAGVGASTAPRSDADANVRTDRPAVRDRVRNAGPNYQPPRAGGNAGAGESESGPVNAERPASADTRMNDSTAGSARAK